jgi:hypothetical protein
MRLDQRNQLRRIGVIHERNSNLRHECLLVHGKQAVSGDPCNRGPDIAFWNQSGLNYTPNGVPSSAR